MVKDEMEKLMRKVNRMRMRVGLPEVLTDGQGNLVNERKNHRFTKLRKGEKYKYKTGIEGD